MNFLNRNFIQRFRFIFIGLSLFFLVLVLGSPPGYAQKQVDVGVSIGDKGLKSFYLSIEEYYKVPEREVIVIKERRIPDEEIPVVFYIAKRARVTPETIIDLRLGGMTWIDITFRYGLSPEIFYVPVKEVEVVEIGPPYGKAYGYYKNKPKKEWKSIVFTDDDVINLVNLRFISEHYGYPPEAVIKMRSKGKSFVTLNDEVRLEKKERKGKHSESERGKGGGKGKGKGKSKGKKND